MRILFFWLLTGGMLLLGSVVSAQVDSSHAQAKWLQLQSGHLLKAGTMLQFWTTYTMNHELYDENQSAYVPVENRFNTYLRRARLLFRGEPYAGLRYYLSMHFDQAGHDLLSATQGPNNQAEPALGIWDAFVQWRLPLGSDALHLTAGWFRPQFQREAITPAWSVASLEKSMSQNYVRLQLVGRGPGRAAGISLGGMAKGDKWSLLYNAGFFNPLLTGLSGNSVGIRYAPLWVARTSLALGDPEMEQYSIAYTMNYFGKRKGISLDFNIAHQGATDQFDAALTYGPGFLLNHGPWTIDGEWIWMKRQPMNTDSDEYTARSATGHLRAGYNIPLRRFVLQPAVMIMWFDGAMDAAGQEQARRARMSAGREQTYDIGINWYLNRRDLAIQFHYVRHSGQSGAAGNGSTVNTYFQQATVGPIRRGNWIGLGFNTIF